MYICFCTKLWNIWFAIKNKKKLTKLTYHYFAYNKKRKKKYTDILYILLEYEYGNDVGTFSLEIYDLREITIKKKKLRYAFWATTTSVVKIPKRVTSYEDVINTARIWKTVMLSGLDWVSWECLRFFVWTRLVCTHARHTIHASLW